MSKKTKEQQPDGFENVQETLNKAELFVEKNKKILTYTVIGIFVVVALFFTVKRFYLEPKNIEASGAMYVAEQYFQQDSFSLALNGDGNYLGFLDVINDYKFTKASNLANYYAGLCYMYVGSYDNAIKYLKKFKSDDLTLSAVSLGVIGDAYVEMGDIKKGTSYYKKAADKVDNNFTSPIYLNKAAQACEKEGNYKEAKSLYSTIKEKYPDSQEAVNAEKNIEKIEIILSK